MHHKVVDNLSRPSQKVELTLARVVAGNNEPGEGLVPGETAGAEALGRVAAALRVPQDINVAVSAVRGGHRLVPALAVGGEGNGDDLVAVGHFAVPRAVEVDEEVLARGVELGVEGSGMGPEGQTRRRRELLAGGVGEGAVGLGQELGAGLGGAVGEQLASPDGEAGGIAVPVLV